MPVRMSLERDEAVVDGRAGASVVVMGRA
jgi:hypothetical protein